LTTIQEENRPVRFGINHLFTARPGRNVKDLYDEVLEQTVLADELGYSSAWIAEHHFSNYGVMPSLATFGGAIAARTTNIRIGTAILVLPFGHPVRLAEEMAMIDVLSNGRLDLGVGRGYQPLEFRGFNVAQDESKQRFDEYLEIMRLAWAQEPLTYKGQFYEVEDLEVLPKPIQPGGPPVLVAAVSPSTFSQMGARGESIMLSPNFSPVHITKSNLQTYYDAAEAAGHARETLRVPPMVQQVFIDNDDAVAKSEPEPYSMWFYGKFATLLPGADGGTDVGEQYEAYKKIRKSVESVTYDKILAEGVAFGNADSIIDRFKYLEQELGVDEIICWFNFGDLPHERVVKNMRMFAEQVMPAFAAVEAAG
jgi:alkanesulfonate monooxygenase SsuD/methylene tetrahydromethanopterin reductase-like flavin-dependent oxidoreductase (luciferase family)